MTQPGSRRRKRNKLALGKARAAWSETEERVGTGVRRGPSGAKTSWLAGKRRVLRFVVILAAATGVFNSLFYLWFSKGHLFASYLGLNAEFCAMALRVLGDDATVIGTSIVASRFSLDISLGCDGIQSSAFFAFAVLASPLRVSRSGRALAVVLGTLVLLTMNLVRIITLFYTGVYFPSAFGMMHFEVWQAVFIFLPILLWIVWVRHEMRRGALRPDAVK